MYCKSINIASRYSIFVYFQKPMQRRRRSLKIHYSRLKHTRVLVKDWRQRVRMTNDVFTFHCCTELHRLTAGELLRAEQLPGPLLVDNMRDEASTAYGALPERLYIVLDRKIVYQADDVFRYTGDFINDNNISREVSDPTITIRRKSIRGWKNIFRNSVDNII